MKWGEATTDEMCIGFIAVTKKGQDLTRPGEKDDLHEIFKKQHEDEAKRRARPPGRKPREIEQAPPIAPEPIRWPVSRSDTRSSTACLRRDPIKFTSKNAGTDIEISGRK